MNTLIMIFDYSVLTPSAPFPTGGAGSAGGALLTGVYHVWAVLGVWTAVTVGYYSVGGEWFYGSSFPSPDSWEFWALTASAFAAAAVVVGVLRRPAAGSDAR